MGIRNRLRNFGGGTLKEECGTNKETGEFTCHAKRMNADGTEVDVRGFTVDVDASCNAVITSDYENEDPAKLEDFQERKLRRIITKCKSKPAEF